MSPAGILPSSTYPATFLSRIHSTPPFRSSNLYFLKSFLSIFLSRNPSSVITHSHPYLTSSQHQNAFVYLRNLSTFLDTCPLWRTAGEFIFYSSLLCFYPTYHTIYSPEPYHMVQLVNMIHYLGNLDCPICAPFNQV